MTTRTSTPAAISPPTNSQSVGAGFVVIRWCQVTVKSVLLMYVSLLSLRWMTVILAGTGIHKSPRQQQVSNTPPFSKDIWIWKSNILISGGVTNYDTNIILADIVIFLSCKIWACMWRFYGKNITIPPENLHFYKLEWELSPDFHSHTLLNNGDPGTQASPPGTLCGWGTNPLALGKSPYNLLQTMQCHLYNSKDFFLFIDKPLYT